MSKQKEKELERAAKIAAHRQEAYDARAAHVAARLEAARLNQEYDSVYQAGLAQVCEWETIVKNGLDTDCAADGNEPGRRTRGHEQGRAQRTGVWCRKYGVGIPRSTSLWSAFLSFRFVPSSVCSLGLPRANLKFKPQIQVKIKTPPTRFAGGSRLRHTIAPMVHPRQPQAPCQFRKKFKGLEASYSVGRHPTTVRQLSPETQATPQTAVRRGHVHFCVLRPF